MIPTPAPIASPAYPIATPPPEPNHLTIDLEETFQRTSGYEWEQAKGTATNAAIRYEFQATPKARFANTVHWQRESSTYLPGGYSKAWWFDYTEYDDEFDVELGRPDLPLGVGVGYFDYTPVHDFTNDYNLRGFGIGIDKWPDYYTPHSWYYSVWYYPSLSGGQEEAGAYSVLRADLGFNWRPNLTRPWNFRIGFMSDTWFAKNGYAADTAFNGAYVGLSYWR